MSAHRSAMTSFLPRSRGPRDPPSCRPGRSSAARPIRWPMTRSSTRVARACAPDRRPLGRHLPLQPELRVLLRRERPRARVGARPGGPAADRRTAGRLGRARSRDRWRRAHRARRLARFAGRDPRRRDGPQRDDQRHAPSLRSHRGPGRLTPAWSTSRPTGRTGSTLSAVRASSTGSAGRPATWPGAGARLGVNLLLTPENVPQPPAQPG